LMDGLFDFDADFDMGDADGSELMGHSLADRFMGWLHFGKVPVLILFATFLLCFGGIGLLGQGLIQTVTGYTLPWWLMALVVIPLSMPCVRVFGSVLAKILPKDETEVSSMNDLLGRMATIVIGTAKAGAPAQARVSDHRGQKHYIMLEPDDENSCFEAGDSVLLVSREGGVFKAVDHKNQALLG